RIAAGDQRAAGIEAEAEAIHHPAGDGEHVLDRPADLRADEVVTVIGAEGGTGDGGGEPTPLRFPATAAEGGGGGQAGGNLVREGGAGRDRDVAGGGEAGGDFVHQPPGSCLDPLGAQDQIARVAGHGAHHLRQMLRRGDEQGDVAGGRFGQIAGRVDGGGE